MLVRGSSFATVSRSTGIELYLLAIEAPTLQNLPSVRIPGRRSRALHGETVYVPPRRVIIHEVARPSDNLQLVLSCQFDVNLKILRVADPRGTWSNAHLGSNEDSHPS